MRKLITFFIIVGSIFITQNLFAQCVNNEHDLSEPKAKVTFDTPRTISPMISKINELTGGDDVLTEMVIIEIYKSKNIRIKDVISNEEYSQLTSEEKEVCISESEVNQIINQIK